MVLTDQRPSFVSAAGKNEAKQKCTDARVTIAYFPQSNCQAERMVQSLKSAIMVMCIDREAEWDELLPVVLNSI